MLNDDFFIDSMPACCCTIFLICSREASSQIGDKVQKGQVLCIIEAMKLLNEIEVSFTSLLHLKLEQN